METFDHNYVKEDNVLPPNPSSLLAGKLESLLLATFSLVDLLYYMRDTVIEKLRGKQCLV